MLCGKEPAAESSVFHNQSAVCRFGRKEEKRWSQGKGQLCIWIWIRFLFPLSG